MIVTVFRSRLRQADDPEYALMAGEMSQAAESMPGYISHKGFVAADGERITIVEFDTIETHRAWAAHHGHQMAKKAGRDRFYSEYSIRVCEVLRSAEFTAAD